MVTQFGFEFVVGYVVAGDVVEELQKLFVVAKFPALIIVNKKGNKYIITQLKLLQLLQGRNLIHISGKSFLNPIEKSLSSKFSFVLSICAFKIVSEIGETFDIVFVEIGHAVMRIDFSAG